MAPMRNFGLESLNPLVKGSAVVFVSSLGGGLLNYLFHFLTGRLLSPSDYGILVSLFSILYIVGVPGAVLGTTVTKFAASYKARGDFSAVTAALVWITKVSLLLGLVILLTALFFREPLADFLKIPDSWLLVFFSFFVVLSFLISAPRGFLRGLLRFKAFAFVSFLEPLFKVLLGVGMAFLGAGVFGVVGGLIVSSLLGLGFSLLLLKKNLIFPFTPSSFSKPDLVKYALPTTVALLSLVSFYNSDVILVKHFFTPEEAGIYGSVVTMGRIIFFTLSTVVLVMFPMASEKHANKEDPYQVLKNSLLLVFAGALAAAVAYSLFSKILVQLFFGSQYLLAAPYLGYFALFMGLYALVDLVSRFFLSIDNFRPVLYLAAFALLQIGLLFFFHKTLYQVVVVNILVMAGVLFSLGIDRMKFTR